MFSRIPVICSGNVREWRNMFAAKPNYSTQKMPQRQRILAQIASGVCGLLMTGSGFAQAIDYKVRIEAPRPLKELLEENLDLLRWKGNPRLDLPQLQRLVKDAPEQIKTLVATEGYYTPTVSTSVDTSGEVPVARVQVEAGAPVTVSDLDLVMQGFGGNQDGVKIDAAQLRSSWALPLGARFRQQDWEAAKRTLVQQVTQQRYPRARLVESSATVDPQAGTAALRVVLDSGPEANFGALRIEGLKRYSPTIINNINPIEPGDPYRQSVLQAFQARVQDTGYFSTVEVSADMSGALEENIEDMTGEQAKPAAAPLPATADGAPMVLPVLVRVTENKQKNVDVGLGYSTNTGYRAQAGYDDLNVFGLRMKSNIIVESKRQATNADFYFPTTPKGYSDSFGASFERNDLRGEITAVSRVGARRAWGSPLLEHGLTLEYLYEQRTLPDTESTRSQSVPLTYSITKRALDNLVTPSVGYVVEAQIGGALLPLLTDERFIRASTRFIYYRPLGPSGTLVLRGEAGALASKEKAGVPGAFLFRAGGDQSVRGYGYQELGVREGEAIVGGRYLLTASAEYQYWFKPPWGVALFYDAGNAADSFKDLKPESGFGIGARWRSPVGPINLDVAYGQATKKTRVHFSLGFTF
jgi:translocation and assembly module TamA